MPKEIPNQTTQPDYQNEIDFRVSPHFDYFLKLTDTKGIIQHTRFRQPATEHGYSIDDQARALLVVQMFKKTFPKEYQKRPETLDAAPVGGPKKLIDAEEVYLKYIIKAQLNDGTFYNYISYGGDFLDEGRNQDNFGRVYWVLGSFLDKKVLKKDKKLEHILGKMNTYIDQIASKRSLSYSLIGLSSLSKNFPKSEFYKQKLIEIVEKLHNGFIKDKDWYWYEPFLTYANGILPYSVLCAYQILKDENLLKQSLQALDFACKAGVYKGYPAPIGHNGWFYRGKRRSVYGQQAIEIADMVLALTKAYYICKDERYLSEAIWWFGWFHRNNLKGVEMLDRTDWSVLDGLNKHGRNQNRGAESIISYLIGYLAISCAQKGID